MAPRSDYDQRTMTPTDRRLRVPADLERLAEVRQLVREASRAAGAAPGTVDDLVQAVDEAAANAITHGYAGDGRLGGGRGGGRGRGPRRDGRGRGPDVRPHGPAGAGHDGLRRSSAGRTGWAST